MSIISVKKLVIGYDGHPLIYPLSFEIKKPGIYAIQGQNGCGKSTLLKVFLGLMQPLAGHVSVQQTKKEHSVRNHISYVPQSHFVNKFFHIPVKDFVKQGFGPHFKFEKRHDQEIKELLQKWDLAEHVHNSFHELSGGQKTRAMLVRAFATHAKIFFLDEPLSNLDSCCQSDLMKTLSDLVKTQSACIFIVDHHLEKFKHYMHGFFEFEKSHDDNRSHVYFK